MRVPIPRLGVLFAFMLLVSFTAGCLPVAALAQFPTQPTTPSANAPLPCLVSLIEVVEVPAREPGVLKTLIAKEGDMVAPDQLLAQIDDTRAKMQLAAAEAKLKVAKTQAANQTNVEYAKAASEVAKAEYWQAIEANKKMPGSVTQAETRRLLLTYHRTVWEIKQAEEDLLIAGLQADVSQAELDAAADNLQRRKILSPLEGEVLNVKRHQGEWVQAGDPVLEVVRVNQLYVTGDLSAADYTPGQIKNRNVTVRVALARGLVAEFTGKITFVSPLVSQGRERLVRATVDNRKDENGEWLLSAGLTAEMYIEGITGR